MIITSCFISDRLEACADLMAQRRQAFFDDPNDIETNHKFRVSIRTMRSLLSFIEPWVSRKQAKAIQANLKRVVKETSRLRELDVFMSLAESLDPAAPELVAFCAAEASQERERVLVALSEERMMDRLDTAVEELHKLSWKASRASTLIWTHLTSLITNLCTAFASALSKRVTLQSNSLTSLVKMS